MVSKRRPREKGRRNPPIFVRRAAPQANWQFDGRLATQIPRVRQDLRSRRRLPLRFIRHSVRQLHEELEDKQHGHRIGNNILQYGDHRERPLKGESAPPMESIDLSFSYLSDWAGVNRYELDTPSAAGEGRLSIHLNRPETLLMRWTPKTGPLGMLN